jgi:Acyl dehydratase
MTEERTSTDNPEYGKMTDEAVERLRSRLGRVYKIEQPYLRHVNQDSITHVARALGDTNPLYLDPEYARGTRYGKMIAQPAFCYGVAWGSWDLRRGQGLPGVHGLHSGDTWHYYRPFYEGDVVHAEKELVTCEFRQGRQASRMLYQADEIRFYNQHNELVAKQYMPMFRFERTDSKKTGKNAKVAKAVYTAEEIAQIDRELESETPRGSKPRYWEDVQIGEQLDPVVKGPLTVPDMIAWLQGVGSPHVRSGKHWLEYRKRSPRVAVVDPATGIPQAVERVHWDEYMAAEIGMPTAYDYGSQRGGYATYFATLWAGDDGWVASLEVQYRGMVFLGDVYRIRGRVVDKWRGAKTGTGYVKAEISSINQRNENVMPGSVIFALPSVETGPVQFPVDVVADGRA